MSMRSLVALSVVASVGASCGSPLPSASGAATATPAGTPATTTSSEADPFDLSGTAWRATAVSAVPGPYAHPPTLRFDWEADGGTGFTGCEEFGFAASVTNGRIALSELVAPPPCTTDDALLERTFLAALEAASEWVVSGDMLTLRGYQGTVAFVRDLPAAGDPSRLMAGLLSSKEWRIVQAPNAVGLDRLAPVRFSDYSVVATGPCGFTADITYGTFGTLSITEVGWDTAGCDAPSDPRPAVARALEGVTNGAPGPEGTVVLGGSGGAVVLAP